MSIIKKFFVILFLFIFSNSVVSAETIKPKKTPLKKLSKQLGNGKLVKINSYQTSDYKGIKEGWYKESPIIVDALICLLYTSPSPRDRTRSRMPSSA